MAEFHLSRLGSMLGPFFGRAAPLNFREAREGDRARYARFFHALLDAGVYLPPSPLETAFVSAAVGPREIDELHRASAAGFRSVG